MARSEIDVGDPPERLTGFPTRTLRGGTALFRMHRRDRGPCWFSSARPDDAHGGRFDLEPPSGTSYWATSGEAAFLETIVRRPVSVVPTEVLDQFALARVELPSALTLANTPVKRARGFGLTAEIHTTVEYARTRSWAAALRGAGHDGLVAIPRHDVTATLRTAALFGRAGEHVPRGWSRRLVSGPVPTPLIDAMASWGIRVVPIPTDVETIEPGRR